jgi:hypothetical protein
MTEKEKDRQKAKDSTVADIIRAGVEGVKGIQAADQDAGRTHLSAREKVRLYLITLFVVAVVYLSPSIFTLAKDVLAAVATIPASAWKALFVLGAVSVAGIVVISVYALWSIFSIPKLAIKRDRDQCK